MTFPIQKYIKPFVLQCYFFPSESKGNMLNTYQHSILFAKNFRNIKTSFQFTVIKRWNNFIIID